MDNKYIKVTEKECIELITRAEGTNYRVELSLPYGELIYRKGTEHSSWCVRQLAKMRGISLEKD